MSPFDEPDPALPSGDREDDGRFHVQICFPEPGEPESWETVRTYHSPRAALHGASDCCEMVKEMTDSIWHRDLVPGILRLRIYDTLATKVLLWENEDGGLAGEWDGREFL